MLPRPKKAKESMRTGPFRREKKVPSEKRKESITLGYWQKPDKTRKKFGALEAAFVRNRERSKGDPKCTTIVRVLHFTISLNARRI